MKRVDAENKLKSKVEELNFKMQQSEELVEDIRSRRQVEIQEVGGQIQQVSFEFWGLTYVQIQYVSLSCHLNSVLIIGCFLC